MKLRTIFQVGSIAAMAALTMAGCSQASAASGTAGWPETFVVTTSVDENNPDADALNDMFAQDMSEYLGIPVEIYSAADYTTIVEGMASGNVQASMVSPMSYFQTKERANAELVASAATAYPYKTVFITQADNSDINSIEDLKGKTFAFVDQASSSGYLYPKAHLVEQLNLDPDQLEQSDYFFSTVAFSGGHPTSLIGVTMGDYDAACVAYQVMEQMEAAGQLDSEDVKIIGETEEIPNPAYVISGDLPEDLKTKFREFLLSYDNEEFFEAALGSGEMRFGEASEEDYEPARKVVELLNIDLGGE